MGSRTDFYTEIRRNTYKSIFLIVLVFLVLVLLSYVIAQIYDPALASTFIFAGAIIAIVQILISYFSGDKIVLTSVGAKHATGTKYVHLNHVVEGLCLAGGIPKPNVYVMESAEINAFATGRDPEHSSICVTSGLLEKLNRQEIEGVVAHELSHVANYDIRFATIAAVLVGMVAIISNIFLRSMFYGGGGKRESKGSGGAILILIGILLAILAPISAKLVQLAISRKREFLADATGAKLTRYPKGLADALEKIKKDNKMDMKVTDAVAPLFFAPVKKKFAHLTSTHPPVDERIKKLRAM